MGLASTVMGMLILVAFIWMLYPFVKKKVNLCISATALLCCVRFGRIPFNSFGELFFIMCSYYSCYMIAAFIIWGLYARCLFYNDSIFCGKRGYRCSVVFCAVLSFALGVQSIRQTVIMVAPMCIVEVSRLIKVWYGRTKKEQMSVSSQAFVLTAVVALANLAGLIAIRLASIPRYTLFGASSFVHGRDALLARGKRLHELLKETTGLSMQEHTCLSIINILLWMIVIAVIVKIYRERSERMALRFLLGLFAVSLVIVSITGLVVNMNFRSVYLFMWFPLSCVAISYFFESCSKRDYMLYALAFVVSAWVGGYFMSYRSMAASATQTDAAYQERRETAEWLAENGFAIVYGRWNSTEELVVPSNGRLEAGCWQDSTPEGLFVITPWLMNTEIYTEECNKDAVYYIHNDVAEEFIRKAESAGAEVHLVLQMELNPYQLYTSSKQLMYLAPPG